MMGRADYALAGISAELYRCSFAAVMDLRLKALAESCGHEIPDRVGDLVLVRAG